MARYHKYHNDWILANKDRFFSWSDMCKEYNMIFGTEIERVRFKNHCSDDLKLRLENYNYTSEQKKWLAEHYPKYGAKKTAKEFNRIFNQNRSERAIKNTCVGKLKVQLNEESFLRYRKETTDVLIACNKSKAYEVGAVGKLTNGYYMVKQEDGSWEYAGKHLYESNIGEVPEGYQVIFLDGNSNNLELDNLAIIPVEYQALMNTHKLRSENPTITETAITWCDLYTALEDKQWKNQRENHYMMSNASLARSFLNASMGKKNSDSHVSVLKKGERANGRSQMDKDNHRCV